MGPCVSASRLAARAARRPSWIAFAVMVLSATSAATVAVSALSLIAVAALVFPAVSAASTSVVAVGDIACTSDNSGYNDGAGSARACRDADTARLTRQLDPDRLLLLGDLQYSNGTLADYRAHFDEQWGRFRPIWIPSPGNHEYNTPGASGYFDYFGASVAPSRGYYAHRVGGWLILSLNSNCANVPCGRSGQQAAWLRRTLAANPSRCIAALWHHPRYSSSMHGSSTQTAALWRILQSRGTDIILTGHDHSYERFSRMDAAGQLAADGPVSFVVGTGGYSLYSMKAAQPGSARRVAGNFGVLRLWLGSRSARFNFVLTNGFVADSGRVSCG